MQKKENNQCLIGTNEQKEHLMRLLAGDEDCLLLSLNEEVILRKASSDPAVSDALSVSGVEVSRVFFPSRKKRNTKIYIAGKVSGEDSSAVLYKFLVKEQELKKIGYQVVNPVTIVGDCEMPWRQAMRICITALMNCDEAYFLKDWTESRGAKVEHDLCLKLDIKIIYEED